MLSRNVSNRCGLDFKIGLVFVNYSSIKLLTISAIKQQTGKLRSNNLIFNQLHKIKSIMKHMSLCRSSTLATSLHHITTVCKHQTKHDTLLHKRLWQAIVYHMPSATCLRLTACGASAHHMCNYPPNRWSATHSNLQSGSEAAEDVRSIRAGNFSMLCMKASLGSEESHNIWSRRTLFKDVRKKRKKKTETRTTMKGNCMSLDTK